MAWPDFSAWGSHVPTPTTARKGSPGIPSKKCPRGAQPLWIQILEHQPLYPMSCPELLLKIFFLFLFIANHSFSPPIRALPEFHQFSFQLTLSLVFGVLVYLPAATFSSSLAWWLCFHIFLGTFLPTRPGPPNFPLAHRSISSSLHLQEWNVIN